MAAGANAFGIRALNKSADIIAAFNEKITSGKQLSSLKGIGKGTVAKVNSRVRNPALPIDACKLKQLAAACRLMSSFRLARLLV